MLFLCLTLFGWGGDDLNFLFHISSSWVEISLYTEFQLPRLSGSRIAKFQLPKLPRSGSSMVGDKQKTTRQDSVELEATLAPAEAEVWAVA